MRIEDQKRRLGECRRDADPISLREQANKSPGYGGSGGAQAKTGVGRLDEGRRRWRGGVFLPCLSMIF